MGRPKSAILHTTVPSPWGDILLLSDGVALTRLELPGSRFPARRNQTGEESRNLPIFRAARAELAAYFAGKLRVFTVPVDLPGTPFQTKVWQALIKVPCGTTVTYGDLAAIIQQPTAARAVAAANARNPLPIIVPCHRVIGKNGALTGYSGGGVERKAALLRLEGARL